RIRLAGSERIEQESKKDMKFQSDSGATSNAGLIYTTRRPEAGPQLRANTQTSSPSGQLGGLGKHNPMMPANPPGAETAQEAVEQSKNFLKRAGDARAKLAISRGSKKTQGSLGWLARDPSEWIGGKIRHRLTGKVYVVRTAFMNGRVELEKSWMTYLSFVWTIRAEFETYS